MEHNDQNQTMEEKLRSFARCNGGAAVRRFGMLLCVILALTADTQALSAIGWSMYGCLFSGGWLSACLAEGWKENRATLVLSGGILLVCIGWFFMNLRYV